MDEMRGNALPDPPFLQRVADEAELQISKIAQAAMHQLGIVRTGCAGKIAALDERHLQSAQARVSGDTRACDAAADNEQVKLFVGEAGEIAVHESPAGSFTGSFPPDPLSIGRADREVADSA